MSKAVKRKRPPRLRGDLFYDCDRVRDSLPQEGTRTLALASDLTSEECAILLSLA